VFEEYREWSRKSKGQHSTIQFQGNGHGVIKVPVRQSSESRTFTFTLSALGQQNEQKDGSLECIEQTLTARNRCLQSAGVMTHKLQVQATDDVYQSTIVKMSQVEEQSKKARAKEIKHSGPNIGRKVKKSVITKRRELVSSTTKPISLTQPTLNRPMNISCIATDMSAGNKLTGAGRSVPDSSTTVNNRKSATSVVSNLTASTAADFTLRDRVVHLLALRPYKKPELILRLQKDGVRTDISSLHEVLESVAECRRDAFTLHRHLYLTDIRQDWPLYSSDDRQALIRKLQSVQEVSIADSPALSPCTSIGSRGSPAPRPSHKRPSVIGLLDKKQQKVSDISSLESPSTLNSGVASVGKRRRCSTASADSTLRDKLLKNPDFDDYTNHYQPIKSDAERVQYKDDFMSQYDEYLRLRDKMIERLKVVTDLNLSLQAHPQDSAQFEKLKQKLFTEYRRLKSDQSYCDERRLWTYLHRKLEYIKQRVHDYDSTRLTTAS
jgi:RNA polymerase II elongation factor ELL